MNELDRVIAANQLRQELSHRQTALPPGIWPWALHPKIQIALQPTFLCPFEGCREALISKLLLVLWNDGFHSRILQVWEPNCSEENPTWKNVTAEWQHPHVNGKNDICMGDSPDALTALTLGLNPKGNYSDRPVDEWLETWLDHDCPHNISKISCDVCGDSYPEDEQIQYLDNLRIWVCDHCLDNYYGCEACGSYVHGDDAHSSPNGTATYCESCFGERYQYCPGCDEAVRLEEVSEVIQYLGRRTDILAGVAVRTHTEYVCRDCWESDYLMCDECEENVSEYAIRETERGRALCPECWTNEEQEEEEEDE